ncbi:DUF3313 domain-containing protein [Syntrophorhabdus aromaticivorans]|uniref:DUF3313 domain-containing protein n=1 Tax=Syntrophorhabdus aromaticivorans TaxID=328301 RepID=A0A351U6U2_9BACT|nr:DUF3313 domain-containing protein [Syntrophorhabdus aromaticivorans]NLW35739.1 DUF3313 domain-containing protein [Syntrophorhabdus aromaticivorans]HBA55673.1 DUF3313 domain-containing protein [Syntrophorhabdus aromaticivorans]
MKKAAMSVLMLGMGLVLLVSTGFSAEPKYSGFLGEYYKNLEPGPKDGAKMRWVKPGVDFTKYSKLMVDSVIFYFADDSEDKGINAEEMKELTDAFNQEIVNALKDKYPIVAERGPDVARLRIAITGVKKSKPGVSVVTSVIPVGIGISLIKKGVGGSYSGSGGTRAEFMALDSMTNDAIVAAVDERTAGYTERFTSLGAAKDAFKFWAERIRKFVDDMGHAKR